MKRKIYRFVLLFFLILTISLMNIKFFYDISNERENNEKIDLFYEEEKIDIENEYIGIIEIPKINLKHGFYHPISSKNKLKSGIKVISVNMDNVLILASHSGSSKIANFNNLSKLKKGDNITIFYDKCEYHYAFDHSYMVNKTGHVYIKYDFSKKVLILITCDLKNKEKQVIYVSYMI